MKYITYPAYALATRCSRQQVDQDRCPSLEPIAVCELVEVQTEIWIQFQKFWEAVFGTGAVHFVYASTKAEKNNITATYPPVGYATQYVALQRDIPSMLQPFDQDKASSDIRQVKANDLALFLGHPGYEPKKFDSCHILFKHFQRTAGSRL